MCIMFVGNPVPRVGVLGIPDELQATPEVIATVQLPTPAPDVAPYIEKLRRSSSYGIDTQKPRERVRPTLVVPQFVLALAGVMEYGLTKNGRQPHDWQRLSHADVMERYRDALYLHVLQVLEDPYAIDKTSGKPVVLHVAANAMILWWHTVFTKP